MKMSKSTETFSWTDQEIELLLEAVKIFASNCMFNGTDWESVKSKYEKIREIFVERYPKLKDGEQSNPNYPKSKSLDEITKERIAAKLKTIRKNFKKAIDCGKRSGGGRVVMTYYDLCHDIWAGAPSTKSIEGGIDSSSKEQADKDVNSSENNEVPQVTLEGNSDDEMERLFNVSSEEPNVTDRREKIAKFLKDQREKRMNSKVSVDKQHLNLAREDLALKRKMVEASDDVDQKFLSNTNKMTKTMENVGNAITCCFEMMKKMYEKPQPPASTTPIGSSFQPRMLGYPEMKYGFHQYFPSNCFNTTTTVSPDQLPYDSDSN